jgi:hypothetical protein
MATPTQNSSQQHHTWIVTFCEGWTCPQASANGWDGALSLGFRLHVLMDRAKKTEWRYRRRGYRQQHDKRNACYSRWDRPYCPSGRLRRSIFNSGVEGMGIERDTQVEKMSFEMEGCLSSHTEEAAQEPEFGIVVFTGTVRESVHARVNRTSAPKGVLLSGERDAWRWCGCIKVNQVGRGRRNRT